MNKRKPYEEIEMTLAFQQGREEGFDFFFRELYPALCFYANRMVDDLADSEEIASDAFIKIWNKRAQFHQPQHIRAYLYRIVRNDCLKLLQRRNKNLKAEADVIYLNSDVAHYDESKELITAEFIRQLYDALSELPTQCSRVFQKLYVEGKSPKETASDLNISIGNVKTQKARGIATLRKRFIRLSSIFFLFLF